MSSFSSSGFDQTRFRTSSSSVPEASLTSVAYSLVMQNRI